MAFAVNALSHADPAAKPSCRYLLFPPAGAALTTLRYLVGDPSGVDVWGAENPGRGRRIADPPPATLTDLAQQVARELVEGWVPSGSGTAGARRVQHGCVRRAGGGVATACPVRNGTGRSGRGRGGGVTAVDAGQVRADRRGHAHPAAPPRRSRTRFREWPEVWDYAVELLRGDLRLASGYQGPAFFRVPCPVAALCGATDPSLDTLDDVIEAWRTWTADPFTSRVVHGGHLGLLAQGRGPEFWSWLCGLEETLIVSVAYDA